MSRKSLLEKSIEEKLQEQRYIIPKEKKEKRNFNLTWLVIFSICISLILSILRLLAFF